MRVHSEEDHGAEAIKECRQTGEQEIFKEIPV